MAMEMVPTRYEVLLNAKKAVIQTNQFDTDLATYVEVTQGITNEIILYKNISNEI